MLLYVWICLCGYLLVGFDVPNLVKDKKISRNARRERVDRKLGKQRLTNPNRPNMFCHSLSSIERMLNTNGFAGSVPLQILFIWCLYVVMCAMCAYYIIIFLNEKLVKNTRNKCLVKFRRPVFLFPVHRWCLCLHAFGKKELILT